MPQREAEAQARIWAVEDAAKIAACREQPEQDRDAVAEFGGLPALLNNPPAKSASGIVHPALTVARMKAQKIQAEIEEKKTAAAAAIIQPSVSWDALYARWLKQKDPKRPRNFKTTIHYLKEHFGECDVREITQGQMAEWREALFAKGLSREAVVKHLQRASGMFKTAAKEPLKNPFHNIPNPVLGVAVEGRPKPRKKGTDKVYRPAEVRLMLRTAEEVKFGGDRHEQVVEAVGPSWRGSSGNLSATGRRRPALLQRGQVSPHLR
jgi:hypothetical protein